MSNEISSTTLDLRDMPTCLERAVDTNRKQIKNILDEAKELSIRPTCNKCFDFFLQYLTELCIYFRIYMYDVLLCAEAVDLFNNLVKLAIEDLWCNPFDPRASFCPKCYVKGVVLIQNSLAFLDNSNLEFEPEFDFVTSVGPVVENMRNCILKCVHCKPDEAIYELLYPSSDT